MIVTGKDKRPLMFFYLRIDNWTAGSVYKYHTLLLKRFGGLLIGRETKPTLGSLIKRYHPDLMFCHGDWLTDYQIPLGLGIPYVLFEHDIHSLRAKLKPNQLRYERIMLESAAGIVFTSEDHQRHCNANFDITKNQTVVHLRPLRQNLAWLPLKKLPGKHLVYAGGLVGHTKSNYGYRSYHKIFEAFINAGWEVHVYPANEYMETTYESYRKLGCHMYKKRSYNSLLQQMSQYTAGLQSYAKEDVGEQAFNYTQTCRPNKVWDYLAAGIPTIGLYPGNCAKIYQKGGWGIVASDTKRSTLENLELPEFSENLRFEQIMDKDIGKLEKVIKEAVGLGEKKEKKTNIEITIERDEEMGVDGKHWYRLDKPVMENGRLLHGRGKRIPIDEAIRLGLYKREIVVKEQVKKRAERRKKKEEKEDVKKEKVEIEVKPLVEPQEQSCKVRPKRHLVPAVLEVDKAEDKESKKKERDN